MTSLLHCNPESSSGIACINETDSARRHRTNLTRQVAADLKEFFKDEVFRTVIPRSIRLAEAPSYGKPILSYDVRSRGAEAYIRLAKDILDHEQKSGTSA